MRAMPPVLVTSQPWYRPLSRGGLCVQLIESRAGEETLAGQALDAMLAAVDFAQQRGVAREAPALWFNGALHAKPPRRAWNQLLAYSMQTELPRLQV